MSDAGGQQGGGRYATSASALVGAMLVIVGLVVLVVVVRSFLRADADQGPPQPVEYLDLVQGLQQNDFQVVYPRTLPDGWIVTEVRPQFGDRPSVGINLYTDDESFVGIRQEDASVDDMLQKYVDKNPDTEAPLTGVGGLSDTWDGWSDSGGDHAYSTQVGEDTVLAFGDVPADELAVLVAALTTDPVPVG